MKKIIAVTADRRNMVTAATLGILLSHSQTNETNGMETSLNMLVFVVRK